MVSTVTTANANTERLKLLVIPCKSALSTNHTMGFKDYCFWIRLPILYDQATNTPISGQVNRASATETLESGLIFGRV